MSLVPEISAAWGTSRAYVYKLAKRGCPLDSVEAATAWRAANAKLGIGYRSHGHVELPPSEGLGGSAGVAEGGQGRVENFPDVGDRVRVARPRKIKLKSVEASLKNAIAVEEQAAEAVQRCEEASRLNLSALDRMVTAVNVYNKAQSNRLETEKRVLEYLEELGVLIRIDDARELIQRAWGPLLARLRSCPKRAAPKANPLDDVIAEEVFREEIEAAISEGQEAYEVAFA